MVNPFKDVNWKPDLAERRKFGMVLFIGFVVLNLLLWIATYFHLIEPKHGLRTAFFIGQAVGALCWLLPWIAKPFYIVWYLFGCSIGIVMSNLLLSAFYYLVVTPTGLIMRALGRDPMKRSLDRAARSYWHDAEKSVDPKRYFRQF